MIQPETTMYQPINVKQKYKPVVAAALLHFDKIAQTRKDIPSQLIMGSARNLLIETLHIAAEKEDERLRTLMRAYGPSDQEELSRLLQHLDMR